MHPLLERAQNEGHPLWDGSHAVFLWQGDVLPLLQGDFTDWHRGEGLVPDRIAANTWAWNIVVPPGVYLEYDFVDRDGNHLGDPLNKTRTVRSGMGHVNHYFTTAGWEVSSLTQPHSGGLRGVVTKHTLKAPNGFVGDERPLTLYVPPGDGPFDLLLCFDGNDFLDRGRLLATVDNLLTAKRTQPMVVALLDNNPQARFTEYAASDATTMMVQLYLLPWLEARLPLHERRYGIMGASMGGLQALYTALRLEDRFDRVLSLSGAFSLNGYDFPVYRLASHAERTLTVRLAVGDYDFAEIMTAHPKMITRLKVGGHRVHGRTYPAGHNYTAWAAELWRDLEPLYSEGT